jgi:regulator of replication initiation timing
LTDLEKEQAEVQAQQVRPLLEKIEALVSENTSLRDANDELTLKLEHASISNKYSILKTI